MTKPKVIIIAHTPEGKVCEDFGVTHHNTFFAVGDGVTRSVNRGDAYPNPSPAARAAELTVERMRQTVLGNKYSADLMKQVFIQANREIDILNRKLGLKGRCDFGVNDLAGCVAAALMLQVEQTKCIIGYIGDCGSACISIQDYKVSQTPDDVAPARMYYPVHARTLEKSIEFRREWRNHPEKGFDRTYGVLTGESAALLYVRILERSYTPGDVLLVYTDGLLPALKNKQFRQLLCHATQDEILAALENTEPTDDVFVFIVRT